MDKGLRRLSRVELVDIIYELKKSNDEKDAQIQQLQAALDDKTLRVAQAGSIAQAALSINGVFEAAQAAANQYLASVKAAAESLGASGNPAPAGETTVFDSAPASVGAAVPAEADLAAAAPLPAPKPPAHFAKPPAHAGDEWA